MRAFRVDVISSLSGIGLQYYTLVFCLNLVNHKLKGEQRKSANSLDILHTHNAFVAVFKIYDTNKHF
jgi:hypothetical protein